MSNFATPASEWMTTPIRMVDRKTPAVDAERILEQYSMSALGVSDGGALVGVVTRTDLLATSSAEPGETLRLSDDPIEELMTAHPITISADTDLSTIARKMLDEHIHRVFVEKDGAPVGVVSTRDLVRAVVEKRVRTPVVEIATKSVVRVSPDDPLALAVDRLEVSNKHGLVVAEGGWPLGTFSQVDALLARAHDPRTPVEEVMNLRILSVPPSMPLYRAAQQALSMDVRRILVVDNGIVGVVSTFDFARVVR